MRRRRSIQNPWLGLLLFVLFVAISLYQISLEERAERPGSDNITRRPVLSGGEDFSYESVPAYAGQPYVVMHDNVPYFTETELGEEAFEQYAELDALGRCGVCVANVCRALMPTEPRGDISSVRPTGWHSVDYDFVNGGKLYNRAHLIGWQLAGENANNRNLITGTRYLNVDGMLPFENMIADYVKETDGHVLYRVTPVFVGEELVARGVLMEAWSVEDAGESICFCVFAYNVQPGVEIDYLTGESWLAR